MSLLSICIPTYRRPHLLRRLLASIYISPLMYDSADFEVCISSHGTEQETVEVIDQFSLVASNLRVSSVEQASTYALNLCSAVCLAKFEYIWIIGDDDQVTHHAIDQILDFIREKKFLCESSSSRPPGLFLLGEFSICVDDYSTVIEKRPLIHYCRGNNYLHHIVGNLFSKVRIDLLGHLPSQIFSRCHLETYLQYFEPINDGELMPHLKWVLSAAFTSSFFSIPGIHNYSVYYLQNSNWCYRWDEWFLGEKIIYEQAILSQYPLYFFVAKFALRADLSFAMRYVKYKLGLSCLPVRFNSRNFIAPRWSFLIALGLSNLIIYSLRTIRFLRQRYFGRSS